MKTLILVSILAMLVNFTFLGVAADQVEPLQPSSNPLEFTVQPPNRSTYFWSDGFQIGTIGKSETRFVYIKNPNAPHPSWLEIHKIDPEAKDFTPEGSKILTTHEPVVAKEGDRWIITFKP